MDMHLIIKIKNKSYKPWVTGGLRKSIKIRSQLYKKWLTTRNFYYHDKYKLYRNKIVAINKIYRRLYYGKILKDSTNSEKMWGNINVIMNKKRPSSNIEKFQVNDKNFE